MHALATLQSMRLGGAHQLPSRGAIARLQSEMVPIATAQPEPEHRFHPGWYERRLLVPAGMLIVGKIHRHAHPVGVIYGRALIVSEFGRDVVEAGYLAVSPAGVKRVVLALEDTLFFTLHRNDSDTHDVEQIEADHIEPEALAVGANRMQVLQ